MFAAGEVDRGPRAPPPTQGCECQSTSPGPWMASMAFCIPVWDVKSSFSVIITMSQPYFSNSFSIKLSSHAHDKTIFRDCPRTGVVTLLRRRSPGCGNCSSCTSYLLTAAAAQGPQAVADIDMHNTGTVDSGATFLSRSTAGATLPSRPGSDDIGELFLLFFFLSFFCFCLPLLCFASTSVGGSTT